MGATLTPPRSTVQRMEALGLANHVRSYRATFKRDVKAGTRSALDSLRSPEPEMETMRVFDLMIAIPKVGRGKASKVLRQENVSPSKTLAGMSSRQRLAVLATLRADAARRLTRQRGENQ